MELDKKLICRYYENKYPDPDDIVMVRVNEIAEMGAYVSLLEYNNVEGMILLSELSRRRIRSISKLIRVGKSEVVVVLRVNKEKGYIDLSKSRVTPEEKEACILRFNKSKAVHNLFFHVAKKCNVSLEVLYTHIGWPIYKRFKHAYDAFRLLANGNVDVIKDIKFPSEEIKEEFLKVVKKRLKPQDVKVRADFEITCFTYEGVNAIRKALLLGEEGAEVDEGQVKITLVAPPLYVMTYVCKNNVKGKKVLEDALGRIKKSILESKGKLVIKAAPRAVTKRDEKSLIQLLEQLKEQNKEVDGDDDDDQYM